MKAIEYIYNELHTGRVFGKHHLNVNYPYISADLYLTDGGYIGYSHFGSSAVKDNIPALEWVIRNIFDITPEKFLESYVSCNHDYYVSFDGSNT